MILSERQGRGNLVRPRQRRNRSCSFLSNQNAAYTCAGATIPKPSHKNGVNFFERVRAAYLERARAAPGRIVVIDASKSIDEIQKVLREKLSAVCPV